VYLQYIGMIKLTYTISPVVDGVEFETVFTRAPVAADVVVADVRTAVLLLTFIDVCKYKTMQHIDFICIKDISEHQIIICYWTGVSIKQPDSNTENIAIKWSILKPN